MCMQKVEGNLACSSAFQLWMTQIRTGQVCGMGGGPPCETFTAAGLLEDGPPPLRAGSWPLGFPNLRLRSWQQCMVGSRLIRFLLEAIACLACTGGTGFLEHPQYPLWAIKKDPVSIWQAWEVRLLRTLGCIGITSFDQCVFGSPATKPTTILHLRLPGLRRRLLTTGLSGRCHHGAQAHERMSGRDDQGEFKTARAKVYPEGLNRAIAEGIHEFVLSTFSDLETETEMPAGFSQFAEAVFAPMDVIQPDYHGWAASSQQGTACDRAQWRAAAGKWKKKCHPSHWRTHICQDGYCTTKQYLLNKHGDHGGFLRIHWVTRTGRFWVKISGKKWKDLLQCFMDCLKSLNLSLIGEILWKYSYGFIGYTMIYLLVTM